MACAPSSLIINKHFPPFMEALGIMKMAISKPIVFILLFCRATLGWSHDLTGQWGLKVEDKKHRVVTTLVIKFSQKKARSCIGGDWLQVNVVSSTTNDNGFYPVNCQLSYGFENNQLVIGCNETCDAYHWLQGPLDSESAKGEYFRFGWERESLGFFTLRRQK